MGGTRAVEVLHVDDDQAMLDLTVAFLERLDIDARLTSVDDATEALDRLGADRVDVVVSDYSLPDRSGIDFLEHVRADHPELPFIFFTGRTDKEAEALDHGATDYIVKGNAATFDTLARSIVTAVEGSTPRELEQAN